MGLTSIRLGSVVIDRARNKPLRVVGRDHRPAGEHPDVEVLDQMAREWGVTDEDTVWHCVFLPTGEDAVTAPKKAYSYPDSRLTRYPVEAALPSDSRRIHTQVLEQLVAGLLEAGDAEGDSVRRAVEHALVNTDINAEVPPEVLLEEAAEMVEAGGLDGGEPA